MTELQWSDIIPGQVVAAAGTLGTFVALLPRGSLPGKLYLFAPGQNMCPVNERRALRFQETHNPQRRAQAWENGLKPVQNGPDRCWGSNVQRARVERYRDGQKLSLCPACQCLVGIATSPHGDAWRIEHDTDGQPWSPETNSEETEQ